MVTALKVTSKSVDNTQRKSAQEMLASIQSWQHWDEIGLVVAKEYYVTSKDFAVALPEYQKFLCLAVMGYEGLGMYSNLVDMLWHGHILTTVLYAEFCTSILGKFVHHIPNTAVMVSEEEWKTCRSCRNCSISCKFCSGGGSGGSKETFIAAYQAAFGPISPVWELSQSDGIAC
ncbi:hypothetical protein KDW_20480 [Dictyobacter vulcani]|uniref:Uncharacterized protein n=1 Tax=Dictyobacter vulcani TaxID=2607529 RepID=A0A5J4KRU5_9CHLR|nr:hypothetical protein [Dictyobacter vulcani]GER87886.1 hypothetical protein KDW_20480 [Dictyobacter vulcani]